MKNMMSVLGLLTVVLLVNVSSGFAQSPDLWKPVDLTQARSMLSTFQFP